MMTFTQETLEDIAASLHCENVAILGRFAYVAMVGANVIKGVENISYLEEILSEH